MQFAPKHNDTVTTLSVQQRSSASKLRVCIIALRNLIRFRGIHPRLSILNYILFTYSTLQVKYYIFTLMRPLQVSEHVVTLQM